MTRKGPQLVPQPAQRQTSTLRTDTPQTGTLRTDTLRTDTPQTGTLRTDTPQTGTLRTDTPQPGTPQPDPLGPVHPFDHRFGTDTGGLVPKADLRTGSPADRHLTAYYAVAPSILQTLVDIWQHRTHPPLPLDRYTFFDVGCGKGRAMLLAAQNPFLDIIGIELNPQLAGIARNNLERLRSREELLSPVHVIEGDALTTQLPGGPTLAFLFHPFEAPAIRRFLRSIETQHGLSSAPFDILYVNAEHAVVLDRHPAFTRLWQGRIPMSSEDHIADLAEIANQTEYGSTGDELCAIYRFMGRRRSPTAPQT